MVNKTEVRLILCIRIFAIAVFLVPLAIYSYYEVDIDLVKYGMPATIGIMIVLECLSTIGVYGLKDK
jgi:hypothetical protein